MSLNASVVVLVFPTGGCSVPPSGLVSWWTGEGNGNDAVGGNNGTLGGHVTFVPGVVGQAFSFDGVGDYVFLGNPTNLHLQDLTIDAWIKRANPSQTTRDPEGVNADQGVILASGSGGYGLVLNPDFSPRDLNEAASGSVKALTPTLYPFPRRQPHDDTV